jgi:hypothetical protein
MTTDRLRDVSKLAPMIDRPLGYLTLASNLAASAVSEGQQSAAENLLVKALRAAGDGDHDRAGAYVARAVRLGFDEYEEVQIAWRQVHLLLVGVVVDAIEECPADDSRGLDATLAVLVDCRDHARTALLHALAGVDRTSEPKIPPPGDEAEQVRAILQILDVVAAYGHVLDPNRG